MSADAATYARTRVGTTVDGAPGAHAVALPIRIAMPTATMHRAGAAELRSYAMKWPMIGRSGYGIVNGGPSTGRLGVRREAVTAGEKLILPPKGGKV